VDIQKVKKGQMVKISLDADAQKKLKGQITQVATIGEEKSGSDAKVFEVIVNVLTKDTTLRPSMTTSCTIICNEVADALTIPIEGLFYQNDKTYVFCKRNKQIQRQEVIVAGLNDKHASIAHGLQKDDEVGLSLPPDTATMTWVNLPDNL